MELTLEKLSIDGAVEIRFREQGVMGGVEIQTTKSEDAPRPEMARALSALSTVVMWELDFPVYYAKGLSVVGIEVSLKSDKYCLAIQFTKETEAKRKFKFKLPALPISAIVRDMDVWEALVECQEEAERYISGQRAQTKLHFEDEREDDEAGQLAQRIEAALA